MPDPAPVDVDLDRLEALEQQIRQLTIRLASWVEVQLAQAIDDRRDDMEALRAELQLLVHEQVARSERAHEHLGSRLEHFAEQVAALAQVPAAAEALEQRVRSAMSRLSDSVEARLDDVDRQRQAELNVVRVELRALAEGRVAQAAESAKGLARAEEQLTGVGQRLDEVAGRVDEAAEGLGALRADVADVPVRLDAFEQRVKAAIGRVTESVEGRLAETVATRDSGLDALREELLGRLDAVERQVGVGVGDLESRFTDRLDAVSARYAGMAGELTGLRAAAEVATSRTDELEKRVKAAVGHLADSVEGKLAAEAEKHASELRSEVEKATAALRGRFGPIHDRIGALEVEQRGVERKVDGLVEAKLAEVVERRQAEFATLRKDLEDSLAAQIREGRHEIAVAVADAHRRFVVSVDRLEERMNTVTEQATAAWAAVAGLEATQEAVASDGRRIEALEMHTRRTDARLGEVVDAKLGEVLGPRMAKIDGASAQLRAALDAHLAETRSEVALALGAGRTELAEGAARLDARQATLDEQAAKAVASLDALSASVQSALEEAESRLQATVEGRLAQMEGAAEARAATAATAASLTRKVTRVQDNVQKKLAAVTEQMEAVATAARRDAGALAPLRSDVRALQTQVAELADVLADLRPKRKAAAPAASPPRAARARKAAALPAPVRTPPPPPALAKKAPPALAKKAPAAPVKKVTAKKVPAVGRRKSQ